MLSAHNTEFWGICVIVKVLQHKSLCTYALVRQR